MGKNTDVPVVVSCLPENRKKREDKKLVGSRCIQHTQKNKGGVKTKKKPPPRDLGSGAGDIQRECFGRKSGRSAERKRKSLELSREVMILDQTKKKGGREIINSGDWQA